MTSERVQRQIDRLLDAAEAAVAQRDWAAVRQAATDALVLSPDNTDALALLAAAERGLSDGGPAPQAASPVAAQPSSFAGGRYTVRKFLGEGGKKKVYLAHDTTLDRDVAFALIKTEGLDEAAGRSALSARRRLWAVSAIIPTSSLSSTSAKRAVSPTWCCRSCPAAISRG
jgi:hypothetical protein